MLGRDDIGSLEVGKAADLVAYRVDGIQHAGSGGDRVAGLLTCAPVHAWLVVINGRVVIERGQIAGLDLESLITQHEQTGRALIAKNRRHRIN